MPSARPTIETTFSARIATGIRRATSDSSPSERLTARAPEITGSNAATAAPNAIASSTSVSGSVRRSACAVSSALVRQMS